MISYLKKRIQNPLGDSLNTCVLAIDDELIRRFRELSEDLWSINKFNADQFKEAEVIPLVASAAEIDDEGAFRTVTTEAVSSDFERLLGNIEFVMALSINQASLLRSVMIRVKSKCKIKPHIDDTFAGIPHSVYRCQLSGDISLNWTSDLGGSHSFIPEVKRAVYVPPGTIQEEENLGLNDSIHLIMYMQNKVADNAMKTLAEKQRLGWDKEGHNKLYAQY